MTQMQDPDVTDAKLGRAIQTALTLARLEAPVIENLPMEARKSLIKARLQALMELGGLTAEELQALVEKVDGTGTGVDTPMFGAGDQLSLAAVISRQLPFGLTEHSVTGAYVATLAGIGGGLVGFATCGTLCALAGAAIAGALTASIDHPQ
jgi:hypothetical protein